MKVDQFKELPSADYMKLGFEHGFDAIVEHQRSLTVNTAQSSADPSGAQVCASAMGIWTRCGTFQMAKNIHN